MAWDARTAQTTGRTVKPRALRGSCLALGLIVWASWGAVGCGAAPDALGPFASIEMTCDNFCQMMLRHCRNTERMYPSLDHCLQTCATWPNDPNRMVGRGNTLQCRFIYADLVARRAEKLLFCSNAGPAGGSQCVDPS
jgi:hypothetical protein